MSTKSVRLCLFLVMLLTLAAPSLWAQDDDTTSATAATFNVVEALPAPNTLEIATNSVITVVFDRPVVPLSLSAQQADLPQPLQISPAVEGRGEWINTSIYVFRPSVALAGGVSYTVTLDELLRSVDGLPLAPYRWTFSTQAPAVVSVDPEPLESGIGLDDIVELTFNQPMDINTLREALSVRPEGATTDIDGRLVADDTQTEFRFIPSERLALDTRYTVQLDGEQVRALAGGAGLAESLNWQFFTVPYPYVVSTTPFDGATDVNIYDGITLFFPTRMNRETLRENVQIEPAPATLNFYEYFSDYDNGYRLNFTAAPSTTYTVTVNPGMEDIYGNVIEQPLTFSYTTQPLAPDVSLQTYGEVGLYNAYNEQTALYLSYRNINAVSLALYDVTPNDLIAALSDDDYSTATNFSTAGKPVLREWQIDTQNLPLNVNRYDLLNMGGGDALSCPNAMPSRVGVGDLVSVISDPDPLRARSAPVDGEILELMYRGYRAQVLEGPRCVNGIAWFALSLRDGRIGWVAESLEGEYFLEVESAASNTSVTVGDGGALDAGVYFLRANSPDLLDNTTRSHFMVVSTASVTLKQGNGEALAWVTDLQSGAPIADVPVQFFTDYAAPLGSVSTNADGIARITLPPSTNSRRNRPQLVALVQTPAHFGMGYGNWADGINPYEFNVYYSYDLQDYVGYLYTDRPVYRPGQPVYFRGVIRGKDDVRYPPPDFAQANVQIRNDMGETIYNQPLALDEYGSFSDVLLLAEDAVLGGYSMSFYSANDPDRALGYLYFTVAEYRVPEFSVALSSERDAIARGERLSVLLESRYFFGGDVSDANVDYVLQAVPYTFNYQGDGYYNFGQSRYTEPLFYYEQTVSEGTAQTDANGQVLLDLASEYANRVSSQRVTIEATVSDESGLAVAGRTSVVVHQGEFYVGVGLSSYVLQANDPSEIRVITVDWDSQPMPRQSVDVLIEQLSYASVSVVNDYGNLEMRSEETRTEVFSRTVTTDADGKAALAFTPREGGIYSVTVSSRDERGKLLRASETFWVSGGNYIAWRQRNDRSIELVADAELYQVGDTAEILVTSPFQGEAEALITVERDGILQAERVTMTGNSMVYRLPITDDFAPNVFVSVLLMKGVDENNPLPSFRYGIRRLNVDPSRRVITLTLTPDVENAAPGQTVTYTVLAQDYSGAPVPNAQVGVMLSDLASLSVAEPNSEPILSAFYNTQGLNVYTSTPLTINTDAITRFVEETIKGGGGGGGGGFGVFEIRSEFLDTALWNASLITDANGEAVFSVELPDNLTTWRLDARAVSLGQDAPFLVGQQTFDLIASKPLLVRPVNPRFFVVGDEVMLAAIVNNNTDSPQDVTAFLEAQGVTLVDGAEQRAEIPAGGRARFEWLARVDDVEAVDLTFFAEADEFNDATKPTNGTGDGRLLPVYRYTAPEFVATSGILRTEESLTEQISLPNVPLMSGELSINLDASLAETTLDGLTFLENYPHQCTEQTVSRFLPNIATYRALQQLGDVRPELKASLDTQVSLGLQILQSRQNVDGGWGWFSRDASNPLVTSYVLVGLVEARGAGYEVDERLVRGAQTYLRDVSPLRNVAQYGGGDWQFNQEAAILYALALADREDVARMANLFDQRERLSVDAKAYLMLAFIEMNPTDVRIETLKSDLFNAASVSATGTFWSSSDRYSWSSNTRATALALKALIAADPQSPQIPNVVRYLVSARTADAWETTQETAWAVMALTDWMLVTDELSATYDYSVTLNDETLTSGTVDAENRLDGEPLRVAVADLLAGEANTLVIERGAGEGALYYTAALNVALPTDEISALESGVIVSRRYVPLNGADEVRVGDLIEVRLSVIAPQDLHYVMVQDPIPAGTEAINPELATEVQIGTRPQLDPQDPFAAGWGWWWFSDADYRDEAVVLYSTYLPRGAYEYVYTIRATVAGTYNVLPTVAQEFYFPDVYGRSDGMRFTVLPPQE